jgi:hypothetical protein
MFSRPTCRHRFCGWTGTDRRSAEEHFRKKGFTVEGGKAHLKVKAVDTSSYVDKTQQFLLYVFPLMLELL